MMQWVRVLKLLGVAPNTDLRRWRGLDVVESCFLRGRLPLALSLLGGLM